MRISVNMNFVGTRTKATHILVLNSMMEQVKQENESDQSDSVIPENSVPVIISGLRDQCVKLASPFSLSVTVENADSVTWMLEQQVIEAEPEEGLVLRQSGKL